MPIEVEKEKLIRQFLFGELPEQKRSEFEEQFIADADLFEQIKLVEDDLIEKYVRGWMNPAELSKFEQKYLTGEKRREKIEFSRTFINKVQILSSENETAKTAPGNISEMSFWEKLGGFFSTPRIALATAFTFLIAAFAGWFFYQNLTVKKPQIAFENNINKYKTPEIIEAPAQVIPSKETDNSENRQDNTFAENEDDLNNSLVKEMPDKTPKITEQIIQKSPTPEEKPTVKSNNAPNPMLALFAGTLRSGGKNNVLTLPENSKGATLQLNLESNDYKVFKVELNDADGKIIFRKNNLKSRKSAINVFIPADKLQSGDYLLKLFGENESVADFQFRVN